jgi:hypothetical protein
VHVVVGGIASVLVVEAVGVVFRVHGRHGVTGRRHRRTEAVVVEAVVAGAAVVGRTGRHRDHDVVVVARTVPVVFERLEVFEGGEAVELTIHLVVRHDRVDPAGVGAIGGNLNFDSLDTTGIYSHVFPCVVVAVVGVKVEIYVTPIGVVSDVFHVVVDRDRVVVVHHNRL